MLNSKRGISGIIVALIMILLALVAAGIIWVVVRNVAQTGTEEIGLGTKCLAVNVQATRVDNLTLNEYSVTLHRSAGGGAIGGVKVVLTNATQESYVHDSSGNIGELASKTVTIGTAVGGESGVVNANKAEVVAYFVTEAGEEQICPTGSTYTFTL